MASDRAEPTPDGDDRTGRDTGGWDTHLHVFDQAVPVQPGHYQPAHCPLEAIEGEAKARLGVQHLVLVQPSVYGQDHSVLLKALRQGQGRHRGVVVPGEWLEQQSADGLDALHALGVRGVRLNCVSPQGEGQDPDEINVRVQTLMPMLKDRGWHLQWYITPSLLPSVARWHAGSGVIAVLDHLAGLTKTAPGSVSAEVAVSSRPSPPNVRDVFAEEIWQALQQLARQKAWIKLSGWYRLQSVAPYRDLHPLIVAVSELFKEHLVWGSDWPHTAFAREARPDLLSTWWPVVEALGERQAVEILRSAGRLYR